MPRQPVVLYEDNHLLVIDKPAGWLVQSDRTGDRSLRDFVADHRRRRKGKSSNVFVGVVHRIDRPVPGQRAPVVVEFARRLGDAFRVEDRGKLALETPRGEGDGPGDVV